MPGEFNPIEILHVLEKHGVKFVVVGGFAAWMQGAPVITTDVDIVYEATPENIEALIQSLAELDAIYRHQMDRIIRPDADGLASTTAAGHHLLQTHSGNLDVLRTAAGFDYAALAIDPVKLEIDGCISCFAKLEKIIAMKERAGRPKDLAALPSLRAALEQGNKD